MFNAGAIHACDSPGESAMASKHLAPSFGSLELLDQQIARDRAAIDDIEADIHAYGMRWAARQIFVLRRAAAQLHHDLEPRRRSN
jgi:hypothetical protein